LSGATSGRRSLRNALLRFALMVAVLLVAFFVFRQTELADRLSLDKLIAIVDTVRGWWWSPLALIGLWTALSPLGAPGTPFLLAGGIVFGPWWGSLYNLIGAVLGAATSFLFARLLGHDLVGHVFGEERLVRLERRIEHYGFWSMASLRLIPIPWPIINFGAALAGLPFWRYVVATTVGLVPQVFVFTFFYASLGSVTTGGPGRQATLWLFVALALLTLLALVRFLIRRQTPMDG